ncbi:efflux RND transporter periplasmic adaptor subunit [Bryobacter aggregatus]|uniref:efflux RND transporter periplasmic adaptor subunit n=1 Tax=Bryobacter aggregatus TaxID=360054 RepID=UPI000689774B|nr:efflux RND transporter periplasmic adaptor subunit [Bryobacter aggregatus]
MIPESKPSPEPGNGTPPPPAQAAKAPSRRRWPWVLLALLLLGIGVYFFRSEFEKKNTVKPKTPASVPVVTAAARTGSIGVYDTGLGAVTPLATVTIHTRVDGQLMSVRFREGEMVHKGDLLVELDDGPYRAALTQAEGQLIRDQATLDNARIDLARYQQLFPLKAIPQQQLATQQATVHQNEGIVKLDQGLIDSARVNLDYCRIHSPVTGRVGLRLVDAGNIVHATDTTGLLVITQMDPMSVIFTVAEDQLPAILAKVAAGKKLQVDAYARDAQLKLAQGTLVTIDNQIDPTTGTVKLRALFDNPKGTLFPNQLINARLLVQMKTGVTLVPTAAIQRNVQASYVYVVGANSTVKVHPVKLGTSEGDETEVISGVQPGDVVVMTGVDKLEDGTKVIVQKPTPPTPAPAPAPTKGKGKP